MDAKRLKDIVTLADIINSYGDEGGKIEEICREFMYRRGINLQPRTFHRYREGIAEFFDLEVSCRKAGPCSRYFIAGKGAGKRDGSSLEVQCVNSFLLGNAITDVRFPKDRIHIAPSYSNPVAIKVAHAISMHHNIKVTHRRLAMAFFKPEGGEVDYSKAKIIEQDCDFEFSPYAMSYDAAWFMFGKRTDDDKLLVFSLQNVLSVEEMRYDSGDFPEDFNLQDILDRYNEYFPYDKARLNQEDDRLLFLNALKVSSNNLIH